MTEPVEIEKAVIGSVLLKPGIVGWLPITPAHFSDLRCRHLYAAAVELFEAGRAIDELTLFDTAAREVPGAALGGPSFLGECAIAVPVADNAGEYAQRLRERFVTREVIQAAANARALAQKGTGGDQLLEQLLRDLSRITGARTERGADLADTIKNEIRQIVDHQKRIEAGEQLFSGIPTGISKLDEHTGGLPIGTLTLLGARPSVGKSAVAGNIAEYVAEHVGGVHGFTLEDRGPTWAQRSIARAAGVSVQHLRSRDLGRDEMSRAIAAADALQRKRGFALEHAAGWRAAEIVRCVRARRHELKTRLVFVDYLQLVKPLPRLNKNESADASLREFSELAQDGLAVLVLSQLNRGTEKRDDPRPRKSDFRDSGTIEEHAKLMIGLHYPRDYSRDADPELLEAYILKNHQGEKNKRIRMHWEGQYTRLSDNYEPPQREQHWAS